MFHYFLNSFFSNTPPEIIDFLMKCLHPVNKTFFTGIYFGCILILINSQTIRRRLMELQRNASGIENNKTIDHQHSGNKRLHSDEEKKGIKEPEDKVDVKFSNKHGKSSPIVVAKGIAKGTKVMAEGFAEGVKDTGNIVGGGMGRGAKIMGESLYEGAGVCGEVIGKGMGTGVKIMGKSLGSAPAVMYHDTVDGLSSGFKSLFHKPSLKKMALMAGFGAVGVGFGMITGALGAGILGYLVFVPVLAGLGGQIASNMDRPH
jgi:hypothetical protein